MKMKYDGVFYESNSGVGKSIQMFENATKTKINAMRLTHNLLVDWVHRQKKHTHNWIKFIHRKNHESQQVNSLTEQTVGSGELV